MTQDNLPVIPDDVKNGLVAYSAEDIAEVSKAGDYLPRLQVMGSNSEAVKESKIAMGVWGLVFDKDKMVDLGKDVDVFIVTVRPKAMRMDKASGNVFNYFDLKAPEFKKIQADSQLPDSGCMFGPEFLVWIPSQRQFAAMFFGSKSGRREAPSLLTLMKKEDGTLGATPATLKVKYVKTPKYSWHAPQVVPCSTPLTVAPDENNLRNQIQKFNNPPSSTVETVEAADAGRAR